MIFRVNANTNDLLKNIEEEEHEGENQESYYVPWSWTNMEELVKNSFSEGEFSKQGRLNISVFDEQESLHTKYGSLTSIALKEEFPMVIKQELDVKQWPTVDQSVACSPSCSVQSTIDPSTSKPVPNTNEPEVELFEESKTLCTFPECEKVFNGSAKLKEHIKNVHKPLKPCQYCFKEVRNLSGHIKDVHAPKEEVLCPFCAKVYNSKSSPKSYTNITYRKR